MSIEVCIVTYESERTVVGAVNSLQLLDGQVTVAIHDNSLGGRCVELAQEAAVRLGLGFRAQSCGTNCGFARGCNSLAFTSTASHLMFLNPDAEITAWPGQDVVARPAVVGAHIHDATGQPTWSYGQRRQLRDEIALRWLRRPPAPPAGTGYISGAAMMVPRDVFARVGGFDESFFLYYEDIDLCLRANQIGFPVLAEPRWQVRHIGAASARTRWSDALLCSYESSRYFFGKHLGKQFSLDVFTWADAALRVLASTLTRGRWRDLTAFKAVERRARVRVWEHLRGREGAK